MLGIGGERSVRVWRGCHLLWLDRLLEQLQAKRRRTRMPRMYALWTYKVDRQWRGHARRGCPCVRGRNYTRGTWVRVWEGETIQYTGHLSLQGGCRKKSNRTNSLIRVARADHILTIVPLHDDTSSGWLYTGGAFWLMQRYQACPQEAYCTHVQVPPSRTELDRYWSRFFRVCALAVILLWKFLHQVFICDLGFKLLCGGIWFIVMLGEFETCIVPGPKVIGFWYCHLTHCIQKTVLHYTG